MQSEITNRKLGIEIEVVVPIIGQGEGRDVQDLLARVLSNHGIPAVSRGYTRHAIPTGCLLAIEHDASLQDETRLVIDRLVNEAFLIEVQTVAAL